MVRSDLVGKKNLIPGEAVTVLCAHGDTALYPQARVTINVEGIEVVCLTHYPCWCCWGQTQPYSGPTLGLYTQVVSNKRW